MNSGRNRFADDGNDVDVGGRLNQLPRVALFQDLGGERRVQRVTAAMRHEMADHGVAHQREVADDVEDLVTHELVVEAKGVVEHARLTEDDRVVERAAKSETALAQHFDFLQKPERAGRRDVFDEALFADLHRARLVPQQRVIEADAVGDLQLLCRVESDALVALRKRDRPQHLQVATRRLKRLHPGLVQDQVNERGRAAVHDRHFG